MNNWRPFSRVCLVAAFAFGVAAQAQDPATVDSDEPEELRRYTVEMIIFAYTENVAVGSEVFVPDAVVPDIDDEALQEEVEISEPGDIAEPGIDVEIRSLSRDELTMANTLERLERLDAYRPLMHFGWTQTTLAEEMSPVLQLARFGSLPAGLDGELKLYLSRFLHLVVNVSMLAPDPDRNERFRATNPRFDAPLGRYGNDPSDNAKDRGAVSYDYEPLRYRISEDRIMKNGETRYYDHPKIGVIAKVTRVEEEPGESVRR